MEIKKFGKNKEFKLISTFSKKMETYTRYFYECQCLKCGDIRTLSQSDVNDGVCLKCKKQKTIDSIIGQTINIYKVLEFSHAKKTLNFYKCECIKCGKSSVVSKSLIQKNKECSFCRKHGNEPTEQAQINFIIDQYKRGAKQRNLDYILSENEFINLIKGNCYYCNTEPQPKKYRNSRNKIKTISYNGIDRVDSSLGYNKNNCISCCEMCNRMKMAYKQQDFLEQIKKIHANLLN